MNKVDKSPEQLAATMERGHRADMLQATATEIVGDLRGMILEQFQHTPVDDVAGFQLLRLYLELLSDFEQRLLIAVSSGQTAQFKLDELRERLN